MHYVSGGREGQKRLNNQIINHTDCRADTTAKGSFIWTNISTSTDSSSSGPELEEGGTS